MKWILDGSMTAGIDGKDWFGRLLFCGVRAPLKTIEFCLTACDATDALDLAEAMLRGLNAGAPDETKEAFKS